jgi:membrane protein CcdC involved in cytochrome C biogenesis
LCVSGANVDNGYAGHTSRLRVIATNAEAGLKLDIIVPVVMSCALLWWIGRGMSWTTRLVVTAITLAVIICILLFERSGF